MKDLVINSSINLIKNRKCLSDTKIEEIKYGLLGLYLLISKTIVIMILALVLNIFWQTLLFIVIYNIIRMPSFGLHATKSWICLIASCIIFIVIPLICINIQITTNTKFIITLLCSILLVKNSPADTYKRPIINSKLRLKYKIITCIISIVYLLCSILINNNLLSNMFLFALIVQSMVSAPTVYKIFNLPYDNYKQYI